MADDHPNATSWFSPIGRPNWTRTLEYYLNVEAVTRRPSHLVARGGGMLLPATEGGSLTADTICDLLRPLIGMAGSIYLVVSRTGPIGFATAENKRLTGVEVRPDGLVHLERENGWAVIDPSEVMAVVWNGDTESSPGQFL